MKARAITVAKICFAKSRLYALCLWVVVTYLFGSLNASQAQGFLPGEWDWLDDETIDDILEGAGSLDNALNGLISLIDNGFKWDTFVTFACDSAKAADEYANSDLSKDAEEKVCDIAELYEEVQNLFEDSSVTVNDIGTEMFSENSFSEIGFGFLDSEQLRNVKEKIDQALDNEKPQDRIAQAEEIFREAARAELENRENMDFVAEDIIGFSSVLELGKIDAAQDFARDNMQQFQVAANTKGSFDIAKTQADSDYAEAVSGGVKDVIAPIIRHKSESAVSTRATVQEVVGAITSYMAQDADQFAYLSTQLSLQAQQSVYTTHSLQVVASTLVSEQSQKTRERQARIDAAITNSTNIVSDGAVKLVSTLSSFSSLQGDDEPLPPIEY